MFASYGTLALTNSSPPQSFSEPLTLAEVKSYLNIPVRSPIDNAEDTELQSLISAAREQAEILQNRDLVRKQFDLVRDYWWSYEYRLRTPSVWPYPYWALALRSHLVSVDLVTYKDSTGIVHTMNSGTDYIIDTAKNPGLIMPPYGVSWPSFTPWPSSSVLIRFTAGLATTDAFWADAGHRVKNGMKLLISAWFNNRLPFELGASAVDEYPFTVMASLTYGAVPRVR